jgi:hypothetical protein
MDPKNQPTYPLLEALLYAKGLKLQGTYTNADVASLFGVSVRTIQSHVADGSLPSRKLIGRARFLSVDLEKLLSRDKKNSDDV